MLLGQQLSELWVHKLAIPQLAADGFRGILCKQEVVGSKTCTQSGPQFLQGSWNFWHILTGMNIAGFLHCLSQHSSLFGFQAADAVPQLLHGTARHTFGELRGTAAHGDDKDARGTDLFSNGCRASRAKNLKRPLKAMQATFWTNNMPTGVRYLSSTQVFIGFGCAGCLLVHVDQHRHLLNSPMPTHDFRVKRTIFAHGNTTSIHCRLARSANVH